LAVSRAAVALRTIAWAFQEFAGRLVELLSADAARADQGPAAGAVGAKSRGTRLSLLEVCFGAVERC